MPEPVEVGSNTMGISRRSFIAGAAAVTAQLTPTLLRAASPPAPEVIVIGAGLAGLAAALLLEQAGVHVVVLESQRRVGGKMLSFDSVPGRPEAGGQSIGPGYGRVLTAARTYGVELVDTLPAQRAQPQPELALGGRIIPRSEWPSSPLNPFPENARGQMPWQYAAGLLGSGNPLQPGAAWYDPAHAALDVSMHEFLRSLGASPAAIELAYDTNVSYGTSAWDVSALQMMFIDAWSRGQRQIRPAAVFRAAAGNQRIPEAMAGALKGDLRLGARVVAIDDDGARVTVTCDDGSRVSARAAICALPFSVLRDIRLDPLPGGIQAEAIDTLAHQAVTQVALVARKPFWLEDGLAPGMWCDGPLARVFAHHDGDAIASLLVTAYGRKATALDRLGPAAATALVISEFERLRPAASGLLEGVAWHSWSMDPHAAGDWAVFAPGSVTRYMPAMFARHGRLHFCGEQTALANRGMEGAMESGERAALEMLDYL